MFTYIIQSLRCQFSNLFFDIDKIQIFSLNFNFSTFTSHFLSSVKAFNKYFIIFIFVQEIFLQVFTSMLFPKDFLSTFFIACLSFVAADFFLINFQVKASLNFFYLSFNILDVYFLVLRPTKLFPNLNLFGIFFVFIVLNTHFCRLHFNLYS